MASSLPAFAVRRGEPVLVVPAAPTPREVKPLSDIDDGEGMRFYSSGIHLYRGSPSKQDPACVIREALARALVPYYPLAGRLREEAGRKLAVDCGAQGVMFAEADADLTAADFGDLRGCCPPFPCFERFILESTTNAGAEPVIGRPLLYFQVTRLKCGGFVFGHRVCHCMADAPGGMQFQKAIGELARGAATPSVAPAWGREMFMARQPPQPCYPHLEYVEPAAAGKPDRMLSTPPDAMARVHFFFGPQEIAGLRRRAPQNMSCSRFELVAAGIWHGRTAALGYAADVEVRLSIIVNARGRGRSVPLPEGFYGNAFAYSAAATTAGELCCDREGLGRTLELVKKAKSAVTGDYLQSVADLMVLAGRPLFALSRTYIVSDVSHAGFKGVDFGWGEAVYGGPAKGGEGPFPGVANHFLRSMNGKGEEGIVVPVCLPEDTMEKFQLEIQGLTAEL